MDFPDLLINLSWNINRFLGTVFNLHSGSIASLYGRVGFILTAKGVRMWPTEPILMSFQHRKHQQLYRHIVLLPAEVLYFAPYLCATSRFVNIQCLVNIFIARVCSSGLQENKSIETQYAPSLSQDTEMFNLRIKTIMFNVKKYNSTTGGARCVYTSLSHLTLKY